MDYTPENVVAVADPVIPGWQEACAAQGLTIEERANDGKFYCKNAAAAQAVIAAHSPLSFTRQKAVAALGEAYKLAKAGGHVTATVPSIRINTTPDDVQDMIEAYLLTQADATQTFIFQDADGVWRNLSKAQTATLLSDYAKWKKALAAQTQALYAQIMAAATWQDVQAIDLTVGWPA